MLQVSLAPDCESRRDFLKATAAVGGGLLIGVVVPGASRDADAASTSFQPNAFVRITPDNTVTVIVGLSEMGQGVLTAIPQLVAEELDADWTRVRFEQAPADPTYKNPVFGIQATGGSTSVRGHWEPMRKAGATARAMLIAAAAQAWRVDASSCRTNSGWVTHASGKKLSYGQLAGKAATLPVPTEVKLKEPKDFKILGRELKRLDTSAKVNGSAKFGIDVQVPGMLVAVVARSPVIGGTVASFDASKAKAVRGVKHVVRIGSGVAVVADGFWAAKKGRDALEIRWNDGANASLTSEAISTALSELTDKPGLVARKDGDVAPVMAPNTIDVAYEVPYLAHACMEPMNCTAWVRRGRVEVWGPTQAPGLNQMVLAKVAEVEPRQVEVHTTFLGGGFGRRFAQDFMIDAVQISKSVGAPVKVIYTREDDMAAQFYRPAARVRFSGALDVSGQPIKMHARVACSSIFKAAGFPLKDGIDEAAVEGLKEWPYETPNVQVEWAEYEQRVGVWFWRSVGNSENNFFAESLVDEMAHAAGKDPVEYRRALLAKHPRHRNVLELAATKADWGGTLPQGHARGVALSEAFGSYVAEVAEVSLASDGRPVVHRIVCVVYCGRVANPGIVKRQMQSAIIYALSAALYGKITVKNGRIEQSNFHDYPVLRINEAPQIAVHIAESSEAPGGVGEPGVPPVAPAVANAFYALTRKRIRHLPITPQDLKA
jgi:isoquinoline 1-oxidoreductase beta subunit